MIVNPFTNRLIGKNSQSVQQLQNILGISFKGTVEAPTSKVQNIIASIDDPEKLQSFLLRRYKNQNNNNNNSLNNNNNNSNNNKRTITREDNLYASVAKALQWNEKNPNIEKIAMKQVEEYLDRGPHHWCTTTTTTLTTPSTKELLSQEQEQGKNEKETSSSSSSIRFPVLYDHSITNIHLTSDQKAALHLALQGFNLAIVSDSGVGKSFCARRIAYELHHKLGLKVAVTATTGIAALTIGGATTSRTICPHSSSSSSTSSSSSSSSSSSNSNQSHSNNNSQNTIPVSSFSKKSLKFYDVILIDEISMMNASFLENFDIAARNARPWCSHLPFGGLQVLLFGDFLQLSMHSNSDSKDNNNNNNNKNQYHLKLLQHFQSGGTSANFFYSKNEKINNSKQKTEKEKDVEEKVSEEKSSNNQQKNKKNKSKMNNKKKHQEHEGYFSASTSGTTTTNVEDNNTNNNDSENNISTFSGTRFMFESEIFQNNFLKIKLVTKMRHQSDESFARALDELRTGKMSKKLLKHCCLDDLKKHPLPPPENILALFPTRLAAAFHNESCLSKLHGEEMLFPPRSCFLSSSGNWTDSISIEAKIPRHHQHQNNFNNNNSKKYLFDPLKKFQKKIFIKPVDGGSGGGISQEEQEENTKNGIISFQSGKLVQDRVKNQIASCLSRELSKLNSPSSSSSNKNDDNNDSSSSTTNIVVSQDQHHPVQPIHVHVDFEEKISTGIQVRNVSSSSSRNRVDDDDEEKKNSLNNDNNNNYPTVSLQVRVRKNNNSTFSSSSSGNNNTNGNANNNLSLEKLETTLYKALENLSSSGHISFNNSTSNQNKNGKVATKFITINNNKTQNNKFTTYDAKSTSLETIPSLSNNKMNFLLQNVQMNAKREQQKIQRDFLGRNNTNLFSSSSGSGSGFSSLTSKGDLDLNQIRKLKVGSRVMLLRNISPTLVNGSLGELIDFVYPNQQNQHLLPKELFRANVVFPSSSSSQKHENDETNNNDSSFSSIPSASPSLAIRDRLPLVKFDSGEIAIIPFYPEIVKNSSPESNFRDTKISFMPISAAFASTVHKCQSITVSPPTVVVLDLMRSWNCDHLVYVAASRVKTMKQLRILNFDEKKHLSVNQKALEFSFTVKSSHEVFDDWKKCFPHHHHHHEKNNSHSDSHDDNNDNNNNNIDDDDDDDETEKKKKKEKKQEFEKCLALWKMMKDYQKQ